MKAKIKKTGEILELASYARLTFNACDSYGDPITLAPEEVELIQDITEDEHWQDVRERAAIAAMQGILSCGEGAFSYRGITDEIAKVAVDYADDLVKELKKK